MSRTTSILVLYSRLPGYALACIKALQRFSGHEIHLVRYQADQLAPFEFEGETGIHFYSRNELDNHQGTELLDQVAPCLVVTAGWSDSLYKTISKKARQRGIPVVCGLDNQWIGSSRQRIASMLSPILLKPFFSHLWVPGAYQYEFARRLGYDRSQILRGWYSADTSLFSNISHPTEIQKRFIFVGRMVDFKGIRNIVSLAQRFHEEGLDDWSFELYGSGPEADSLPDLPSLSHHKFLQPEELRKQLSGRGIFFLPSHKEPWGVVVHEFAAAGFPILVSDKVGAAANFLIEGWNGFSHHADDDEHIYSQARKFVSMDKEMLESFSSHSRRLGSSYTPEAWASQLLGLL